MKLVKLHPTMLRLVGQQCCERLYGALLTSARAVLGNIDPRSWREVRTKTTEGQYSLVRLELARLVGGLLYGTRAMLVLNLLAFENKKYTAYDRFYGNGPYGEIPTKKEPIRMLGFTSRLPFFRLLSSCLSWKFTAMIIR